MATEHFDVVVVGMQNAGLIAAGLIARRGARVLVVDHGEDVATYQQHGWRLPLVPGVIPLWEGSSAVLRVHHDLGLGADVRNRARKLAPSFQAILKGHRIDLHSDRDKLAAELKLEFPQYAQVIESFFEKIFALDLQINDLLSRAPALPPSGIMEKLRLRAMGSKASTLSGSFAAQKLLSEIPETHPLRELLLLPLQFYGHLGSDDPTTLHAVRLIAQCFRGALTLDDDPAAFHDLLLQTLERSGVKIRRACPVRQIDIQRRRLTELLFEDDSIPVSADYYVANTIDPFAELLPPKKRKQSFVLSEEMAKPTGGLFVVNYVVNQTVIPKGMAEAVFLLNGRQSPRGTDLGDPPLFLRRYPIRQEVSTPENSRNEETFQVLSVACPVRISDVAHSPDRASRLRDQIQARIGRVIPFMADYLVTTSVTTETANWDPIPGRSTRRIDPWRIFPRYDAARQPVWGVAMRSICTEYKNLFHCGCDVLPGLGVEGEYLTGLSTAERLAKAIGKRLGSTPGPRAN